MPYIRPQVRDIIDPEVEALILQIKNSTAEDDRDGVLNYTISRIVGSCFKGSGWRYKTIARAVAVFECAKLEFYRRIGTEREDQAILVNGDIPEYQ